MILKTKLSPRSNRGNMLCFVTSVFAGILLVVSFFSLKLTRILGSYWEQRTKIEAASLAVAKDLSRIVIEDPNYGFISLSDYAPTGKATKAGDNFFLPVQSINTILATVRLDMIIADQLNCPLMQQYALRDYQNAIAAKDRLMDELKRDIQPGGSGKDIDGNAVSPYADAVAVYNQNLIRMTGETTQLVPGSLKINLGYEDGFATNIRIPQPAGVANVSSNQQQNGFYKAYVNVPYAGRDFMFAPLENNTNLVDIKKFRTTLSNLPYALPCIVECEADQKFVESKDAKERIVHAAAAARPACLIDQRPCPGAFAVSFPNGQIPEFRKLLDVYTSPQVIKCPADEIQTVLAGDYPPNPVSDTTLPNITSGHPGFGHVLSIALYDWLRRSGPNVDINAAFDLFNTPFDTTVAADASHSLYFQINRQGKIDCKTVPLAADTTNPVSHKQYRAVTGLAVYSTTNKKYYDIFVKDYVFQPGRMQGGIHAGEPLLPVEPDRTPPAAGKVILKQIDEGTPFTNLFPIGPAVGAIRPSYQQTGIAVELRFRAR